MARFSTMPWEAGGAGGSAELPHAASKAPRTMNTMEAAAADRPRRVLLDRGITAPKKRGRTRAGFPLRIQLSIDSDRSALVHVHPTQSHGDHRPQHEGVADDPHDVAAHVEVCDVRRPPGPVCGEIGREELMGRPSKTGREGVDRDRQE